MTGTRPHHFAAEGPYGALHTIVVREYEHAWRTARLECALDDVLDERLAGLSEQHLAGEPLAGPPRGNENRVRAAHTGAIGRVGHAERQRPAASGSGCGV